ncbi:MAG: flagellar basal body-associated FliL family protein [Paraperlucidibaca sp.]
MKKMVMIGVGVLVLLAAAVAGTLFMTGKLGGGHASVAVAGAPAVVPVPELAAASYLLIEPTFTVNIDDGFATRFLQVEINLMYREASVADRATKAMPHIRNDILLLLSSKNREAISTPEGRLALQMDILKSINDVLVADTGRGGVVAVYFTKLVVQ